MSCMIQGVSQWCTVLCVCVMCAVLVYGDFGDTQHIGCFNPACDVLAIAKGLLHSILCIRASAERMN